MGLFGFGKKENVNVQNQSNGVAAEATVEKCFPDGNKTVLYVSVKKGDFDAADDVILVRDGAEQEALVRGAYEDQGQSYEEIKAQAGNSMGDFFEEGSKGYLVFENVAPIYQPGDVVYKA